MPDDEQNSQDSPAPDNPSPEMDAAKARIAELEREAQDLAPLVDIGRKQHRTDLRTSIIGQGASLVKGADAAFDTLLAATAARLAINIDLPLSDDDRRKLVATFYDLARPLIAPNPPNSHVANRDLKPAPKRGL